MLNARTTATTDALLEFYRRVRRYAEEGRNHIWEWYVINLMQPVRLAQQPVSRLVGNPPWVVYNSMAADRQDAFREQAQARKVWAPTNLATQNDLAATFVATCVDFYLKPGGQFGFVLPYAALRARQWALFRTGQWSLPPDVDANPTLADLSKDAWDLLAVNEPPFPQANSSVVFGTKLGAGSRGRKPQPTPLSGIKEASNTKRVHTRMPWDEVRPALTFTRRKQVKTAPSEAYGNAFRQGATLLPQPLVVFESPKSRALGKVYFRTNSVKGTWKGLERDGRVEERFVKPAMFSRLLLPFGTSGQSHIIAPFAEAGGSLEAGLPEGDNAADFRVYWDSVDRDWRKYKSSRSPQTLRGRIDYQRGLSSQLGIDQSQKVIYPKSGGWLMASVISSEIMADGTVYWHASHSADELLYLAAVFNAPALAQFFREHCRASDRDFHTGPVRNLPIPKFDTKNKHHANLAAQSALAHKRVAAMVEAKPGVSRNDVLNDPQMQPILASIDGSVRAILPDYCA